MSLCRYSPAAAHPAEGGSGPGGGGVDFGGVPGFGGALRGQRCHNVTPSASHMRLAYRCCGVTVEG